MASIDLNKVFIDLAKGANANFFHPLARDLAKGNYPRAEQEVILAAQLRYTYELQAMTFNVATVLAATQLALAILGVSSSPVGACLFAAIFFSVRHIAHLSMSLSGSTSTIEQVAKTFSWIWGAATTRSMNPNDWISLGNVCILKKAPITGQFLSDCAAEIRSRMGL